MTPRRTREEDRYVARRGLWYVVCAAVVLAIWILTLTSLWRNR